MKKNSENLDHTDLRLISALQADASTPLEVLAANISVSVNTCWRRIKRMEELGIIRGRVTLIDPALVNLGQTVFMAVRTSDHSEAWMKRFCRIVDRIPEVQEFYRMAGEVDYLLKIQCRDVGGYDRVYKSIISQIEIADVSASFAMERIKFTTALPVLHSQ